MSLYPTSLFVPTEENDTFVIPPGNLFVCEIDVLHSMDISTIQQGATQDFSIRAWISTTIGGASIEYKPPEVSHWHPRRSLTSVRRLLIAGEEPVEVPGPRIDSSIVGPGTYYLNVLNLVSVPNKFFVRIAPTVLV